MEHSFIGPSYTLGIEEELMIVHGEGYDLVNAIETLRATQPRSTAQHGPPPDHPVIRDGSKLKMMLRHS